MPTLEENILNKVRSEVDNVMTTLETRTQDAVLTEIENLVILWVELVFKPTNASSVRSVAGTVLDPDQRDFSGNVEGQQMTASGRIHSRSDLNKIDETRGNVTVEGDLVVNKKIFDRQSLTHHNHSSLLRSGRFRINIFFRLEFFLKIFWLRQVII